MFKTLAIILLLWNLFVFLLYGADKLFAEKDMWRVKEATLIWCAFVMGGLGALLGKQLFRHKTKKAKFNILLPIALVLNIILLALFIAWAKGII